MKNYLNLFEPLTDWFLTLHIKHTVPALLETTAPWGIKIDKVDRVHFGLVARGNCWLRLQGETAPISLACGDCFLLAPDEIYGLSDSPLTPLHDLCELMGGKPSQNFHYGGGGIPTTIISSWFSFDARDVHLLTNVLPRVIHVRAEQSHQLNLQTLLQMLTNEMYESTPGSQLIINRLADILFITMLRVYSLSDEAMNTCWLRALSEPKIGLALKLIHQDMSRAWTVALLAESVGMSRSALASQFKAILTIPPLEYITRWRMYKASLSLKRTTHKLIEIASAMGYKSETAFNKAFKQFYGISPGRYRQKEASELMLGED
jgi:AraC-like DNA-binding protein